MEVDSRKIPTVIFMSYIQFSLKVCLFFRSQKKKKKFLFI